MTISMKVFLFSETISGIHSVSISGSQLASAYSQLTQYKQKYKARLKVSYLTFSCFIKLFINITSLLYRFLYIEGISY